jgi:molybdenum cofactor cytidylyltransferase
VKNLGVIILAAGASSRMGRPKMLLPWRGSTVIGTIISQWQELAATQITIVMRPNDVALAAELDRLKILTSDRIENPQPESGMFSSILCATNWSGWKNQITHRAVVLGDQPHLKMETLQVLLDFAAKNPAAICQAETDGSARHPVILPPSAFDKLKSTAAGSLKMFLTQTAGPRALCRVDDDGLSLDLDTPEDYRRLADGI